MNEIEKTITELFKREQLFIEKRTAEAETEFAYKLKSAVEYNKSEGTIKDRENAALIACKDELEARLLAAAESDIAKSLLDDARQVLSARQSLLSAQFKANTAYSQNQV